MRPSGKIKTAEARCYHCGQYLTQTEHHFYRNECTECNFQRITKKSTIQANESCCKEVNLKTKKP